MRYNAIYKFDISNGPGIRISIFTQGCNIRCEGCFNSQLWDINNGIEWTEETFKYVCKLLNKPYISGITWLGGEPTIYAKEITDINTRIKKLFPNKTIWLYTGHDLDTILKNEEYRELVWTTDVLVEGPFIQGLMSRLLKWRGSSNQNIIDINESIRTNRWIYLN